MRKILLLLIPFMLFAFEFKVANYNVENLFDLKRDGNEYKEYIPNNRYGWDMKAYRVKLNNISQVLKDLNADIVALEEIENRNALKDLKAVLKIKGVNYPYFAIADSKNSTVKPALLSKFPIIKKREIVVGHSKGLRNILEVHLDIDGKELIVFVNHWKAKSSPESSRIKYAKALRKRIDKLRADQDFIIVGDFNENYNEYETIKRHRRLNDTHGVTAINHILGTILPDGKPVTEDIVKKINSTKYLYNLWYELPKKWRWSHIFKREKGAIDNMILPHAMFDNKSISYVDNSFDRFRRDYFFKRGRIFRWQMANRGKGRHLDRGYSDHLPIYAIFSTSPFVDKKERY